MQKSINSLNTIEYDNNYDYKMSSILKTYLRTRTLTKKIKSGKTFPISIKLQTVNKCNAHCKFCLYPYSKESKNALKVMNDKLFLKIVNELSQLKYRPTINLTLQNEPLLDKDIFRKIKILKDKTDNKVIIITNGSLLTKNNIIYLRESKLDKIFVSLYATNKEDYHLIENGLDYDKIRRNIEFLNKNKGNIELNVVFLKYGDYRNKIKDFVRYSKEKGYRINLWELSNRTGQLKNYKIFRPKKESLTNRLFLYIKNRISYCHWLFWTMNIMYNGDVILCCHDYSHKIIFGNIMKNSIEEIWNSKKYTHYKSMMMKNKKSELLTCKNCIQ